MQNTRSGREIGSRNVDADISPLIREDFESLILEVGIYQTSGSEATAVVDDFNISNQLMFTS